MGVTLLIYVGPYIVLPEKTSIQPMTVRTCTNPKCGVKSNIGTPFCAQCGSPVGEVIVVKERSLSPFDLPMPPNLTVLFSELNGYFLVENSAKRINGDSDQLIDLIPIDVTESLSRFRQLHSNYIVELGRDFYGKKLEVSYGIITTWG